MNSEPPCVACRMSWPQCLVLPSSSCGRLESGAIAQVVLHRVGSLTPRLRDDRAPRSVRLPGVRGCPEEPQVTGTAVLTRERRRPQPPLSSFGQFGLVCCMRPTRGSTATWSDQGWVGTTRRRRFARWGKSLGVWTHRNFAPDELTQEPEDGPVATPTRSDRPLFLSRQACTQTPVLKKPAASWHRRRSLHRRSAALAAQSRCVSYRPKDAREGSRIAEADARVVRGHTQLVGTHLGQPVRDSVGRRGLRRGCAPGAIMEASWSSRTSQPCTQRRAAWGTGWGFPLAPANSFRRGSPTCSSGHRAGQPVTCSPLARARMSKSPRRRRKRLVVMPLPILP
jgi:hypothetical protein